MTASKDFKLPDTGSQQAIEVIEIAVKAGDKVEEGQTLLTLESDKATMDIPAPYAATVTELIVKVGDKVKTGDLIAKLQTNDNAAAPEKTEAPKEAPAETKPAAKQETTSPETAKTESPKVIQQAAAEPLEFEDEISGDSYASPGVRRLARELDIDLKQITGTADKGRISKDDLHHFIKNKMQKAEFGGGSGLPTMPAIDYSQFGPTSTMPLSRIKRLTAQNLSRNWLLAPHVTQFDEADITELESFRKAQAATNKEIKLTPLVFIMKAVVAALKAFPTFNASLDSTGENLILKQYYHIGIAVDTPEGLVVPTIRDVDQKSLWQLAKELGEVSVKARNKQLTGQDMQGSTFAISSLGGIGGTAFTPIINLPNVAILGVSKSQIKPVYDGQQFQPKLMLPLSLSYDHRVIDGAEAARFIVKLNSYLSDIRQLLL